MYEESGCLSLWMLTRRVARSIGVSTEVIVRHLTGLDYVEIVSGTFVLKADSESPKAKKLISLAEDDFSFMVSDEREGNPLGQEFIQKETQKIDYTTYNINELRSIATGKGIKDAFFLTKEVLIKRIKAKLRG